MATQMKVDQVIRENDAVQKVVISCQTLEENPVTRYRMVFGRSKNNGLEILKKEFYDERGVFQYGNAGIPSRIFNLMARRAAAIMFERRK